MSGFVVQGVIRLTTIVRGVIRSYSFFFYGMYRVVSVRARLLGDRNWHCPIPRSILLFPDTHAFVYYYYMQATNSIDL